MTVKMKADVRFRVRFRVDFKEKLTARGDETNPPGCEKAAVVEKRRERRKHRAIFPKIKMTWALGGIFGANHWPIGTPTFTRNRIL